MYSEPELRELLTQRNRLLISALCIAAFGMFSYFGLISLFRGEIIGWAQNEFGPEAENWIMVPVVLCSFAFFLVPLLIAERRAEQFSITCPNCEKKLNQSFERILKTRCCSSCDKRILQTGKVRDSKTYARYSQRRWRNYLVYWFWTWPAFAVLLLLWHSFEPTSFDECPHMIFLFGLIGTSAATWAWARTNDWRYSPQAIVSFVCLVWGFQTFIQ